MDENPFESTSNNRRSAGARSRGSGTLLLWLSVLLLAALAGASGLVPKFYRGARPDLIDWIASKLFWLCPPLAMLTVIAYRETAILRMRGGEAIYNGLKFCTSCICFLVVGYIVFVPSCVGTTVGLMDLVAVLDVPVSDSFLTCIVTFVITIVACLAMQLLHRLIRKSGTFNE